VTRRCWPAMANAALRRAAFLGERPLWGLRSGRALRLLKQSRRCGLTVADAALRRAAFLIYTLARADTWRGPAADRQEGGAENPAGAGGSEEFGAGGSRNQPRRAQTHTRGNPPDRRSAVSFFPSPKGGGEAPSALRAITRRRGGRGAGKNIGIPRRGRPASFCGPQGRYDPTRAARYENPQEQTNKVIKTRQEEKSTPGGGSPGGFYTVFTRPGPAPAAGGFPAARRPRSPSPGALQGYYIQIRIAEYHGKL
jgi:hypothetical protein